MSHDVQMPVLFDQDCGICTKFARLLGAIDRKGRLELVPFHEARKRGLAKDLSEEEFEESFHAIDDGKTLSGPQAIPAVLERLPLGWVPARAIRNAPALQFVVDRMYHVVARNRHRFSKTCKC
jgi:predicted DCC family thiol-disulfide oxidoreductase YuxK